MFYKLLNISKHSITRTILNEDINGVNLNETRQYLAVLRSLTQKIISDSSLTLSKSVSAILKEFLDLNTLLIQSIIGFLIVPKNSSALMDRFKDFIDFLNKFKF